MINFIKSFFVKRESKFEHPLDAVTTPKIVEVPVAPVVETPVVEEPVAKPAQKKKRNYTKKTKQTK
jgi:hypothetical protein